MIDPQTQQVLRQRFNPDGSEFRNFQLRLLEILEYIDKVCKENNIDYWLSSGTALGAVRHGGFIPWDDDVDIEMSLKSYKEFRKALKKNPDKRFVLQDHYSDPEYVTQFVKIADTKPFDIASKHYCVWTKYNKYQGPFVDVFIMAPSNSRRLSRFCGYVQSILLHRLNYIDTPWLRRTLKNVNFFLLHNLFFPVMQLALRPFAGHTLRHIAGVEYTKPRNSKDIASTQYMQFESLLLPVPGDVDSYLKRIFGDYKKMPDIDKIETHVIKI